MKTYPTDPADILEQAAELLESENVTWIQGNYHRIQVVKDGSMVHGFCAVGALRKVAGIIIDRHDALRLKAVDDAGKSLLMVAMPELPSAWRSCWVEAWNDAEGNTQEQVIDTMKLAAKELRNQRPAA